MSDAAIACIMTGLVNVATMLIGFLTLWVKLRYAGEKADEVEKKLDDNTAITHEVKASADKASLHVEGCDERMRTLNARLTDHDTRISSVEARLTAVQATADNLAKNVDSTRHEMRGHLQSVSNKLDLIMIKKDDKN